MTGGLPSHVYEALTVPSKKRF